MKIHPDEPDFLLDRFDEWLKVSTLKTQPGFLELVRRRLDQEPADLDEVINALLKPDARLRNPNMVQEVRLRLNESGKSTAHIHWFQWLAPIAAAAMLTLAFVSFQLRAPNHASQLAFEDSPSLKVTDVQESDSDVTKIFALAANLHGTANVSSLQSVDNLALLFE